jgi:hypothetical protein
LTYGTEANIDVLTGNIFSSTQVTAAITAADQMIDGYLGEVTFGTTPKSVKALGDQVAARLLLTGLKVQKAAEGKANFEMPQLTKDEKAQLDAVKDADKPSYASQDYDP